MDDPEKIELIRKSITTHEDFPKKGIIYKDILGIFQNVPAMVAMKDLLVNHVRKCNHVDVIVGLESRGFLLGPLLSFEFNKPFVPIRKAGKLPGNVKQENYSMEYGEATFEVQMDTVSNGRNILIIDDLLATGGSMAAAIRLLKSAGANVIECLVIVELTYLHGRSKLPVPVHSFVQYN
ncbi:adenine phosphoribosyltransferase [Chelonus insularis]|uniref:adenine phosphoribosyltransferase n=1 Tax=Chelonus insularis TaxID=460826 RepID=UPI00158DA78A|nr:adenine phosphoribosyltransferase [Chelonus insularis]